MELHQSSPSYKLTIANTGGTNGGPALTITNATQGVFESAPFTVSGTTVFINGEECPEGGSVSLVNDQYAYKLVGTTLTFTTIKNRCRNPALQRVLTRR